MLCLHKISHGVNTVAESVQRVRMKRGKESEAGWLWGRHITSHRGPGSKDQVSDVYQQSIHGGSLAPLTITPQHLAITTQETWGHFPPFTEFRHTPAASHAPPQSIEDGADMETRIQQTKRDYLNYEENVQPKAYFPSFHWSSSQKCTRVVCQAGSVNTKAERVPISLFWSHM